MKKFVSLFFVSCLMVLFLPSVHAAGLTRLQAAELLTEFLPVYTSGTPFDDTDSETVAYYRKMGVVSGVEDNLFKPNDIIKTQDFLLMLKRALDVACPDLFYNNQKLIWHYDQNKIAPYAQSQLAFLSAVGVYNNSGYLNPTEPISDGTARYYVGLARHAQEYGVRSHAGQSFLKKPPVLMYHVIDYAGDRPYQYLFVSPEDFEQQVKYMYDHGYTFLFPEELSLADKVTNPVVITFDDGYVQTYTNAYRILKKYNAKATLYIFSDAIDTDGYCSSAQLHEMSDSNIFRIYSHGKTHNDLSAENLSQLENEFSTANDKIYNATKREVTSIAYPFGFFNNDVLFEAKRYYKNAFSVNKKGSGSIFEVTRTTICGGISLNKFAGFLGK